MTVIEAAEHTGDRKPANAEGGFYVQIRANGDEVRTGAAMLRAEKEAARKGWRVNGRRTTGFPVSHGPDTYTIAYWFHQREDY